jgi:hypothetical protein
MLWSAGRYLSAIGRVKGLQPEAARCWIYRSLASVLKLFVIDPILLFLERGARYFSWLLRWPHSEAAIRIPSGQVLPEYLANILRESHPCSPAISPDAADAVPWVVLVLWCGVRSTACTLPVLNS